MRDGEWGWLGKHYSISQECFRERTGIIGGGEEILGRTGKMIRFGSYTIRNGRNR